ncbi:SOS response-associated peptidase [Ferruginibacter yonginensis]|uniref:Abasic site processing protein n=1 Tax=Ferruginibacter yonginensis TaxID=1310416 RepID=A0ABV8QNZ3_9BACT
MCYVNGLQVSYQTYIKLKGQQKKVAPTQQHLAERPAVKGFDYGNWLVIKPTNNDWDIATMQWGFLPNYIKNETQKNAFRFGYKDANQKFHTPYTTLNAIGNELLKPGKIFREAALHRRCLVLSSGFFEYRHIHPISKKTGKPLKTAVKYPYFIGVKNEPVFFMAGIYETNTDVETVETYDSFAIVTTQANKLMAQIHATKLRMPVILNETLATQWIDTSIDETIIEQLAQHQINSNLLHAYPIAKNFIETQDISPFNYGSELPALKY